MKSFLGWIRFKLPYLLTYGALCALTALLFVYKQNSLIPGANSYELQLADQISAYEYTWRSPENSPFVSAAWIISKVTFMQPLTAARFLTAITATLSVIMFFHLLRNWLLSPGKALVGTVMFATSSWTLVVGRGAYTTALGVFLLLLIFTLGSRLMFTTKPFWDWLFLASAIVLALYTPLLPWLLFVASIVTLTQYRKRQRSHLLKVWQKLAIGAVVIVLAAPLVAGLIHKPDSALVLLGVDNVVDSIPSLVVSVSDAIQSLFFANQDIDSPIGLGKLPMLDIFSLFIFLLGCYYFERRLKLKRSRMLFGGLALGLIVCSLSGIDLVRLSLLLPLVYIFIAAGINELITRWLAVFPRNPIARGLGIVLLAVTLGFVGSYHLRKTFIARPGNPEIVSLYQSQ